jgi:hypothetical protein
VTDIFLETDQSTIENELHKKGFYHLSVRIHGKNLVIYSEEEGEKINRARLTRINSQTYQIGIADHRGKWERTPFLGTLSEMLTMLTEQISFALAKW